MRNVFKGIPLAQFMAVASDLATAPQLWQSHVAPGGEWSANYSLVPLGTTPEEARAVMARIRTRIASLVYQERTATRYCDDQRQCIDVRIGRRTATLTATYGNNDGWCAWNVPRDAVADILPPGAGWAVTSLSRSPQN